MTVAELILRLADHHIRKIHIRKYDMDYWPQGAEIKIFENEEVFHWMLAYERGELVLTITLQERQ